MQEVTEKNIQELLAQPKIVVLDFWAEWCGPCKQLGPIFEKVAGTLTSKAIFGKVNVDNEEQLAQKYEVRGIPCVIVLSKGEEVDRIVGALSEADFRKKLEALLARP